MNLWRTIGHISLYTLIAFGLGAMVVFALSNQWYWFTVIGGCFAFVIGGEIVSFIVLKKSISSQYGEWIKKKPIPAYVALACFSLAMVSLVLHLVAYGLR